jgi:VCBS repeat-containing protein
VTKVSFGGVDHAVVDGVETTVAGQYGTLKISSNGVYTYTSNGPERSAGC